jgi:hypothetical protein
MSSERSPLLNGNLQRPPSSFYQRILTLLKAEGEPSWLASFRWFIFGSWANLLLLLVPVAAVAHYANWDAPLRFGFSFVAIIPLAKVRATRTRGPWLFATYTDISSATWRCHRTDVSISWTDSCRPIERYFWQRSGNHRRSRRALQRRSSDSADFRMYPNVSPYSVHMLTVCRCSVLSYLIFSWFWVAPSSRVCRRNISFANPSAHSTRPTGGIFKHESEFSVTAAQTLAFRLSAAVFAY